MFDLMSNLGWRECIVEHLIKPISHLQRAVKMRPQFLQLSKGNGKTT